MIDIKTVKESIHIIIFAVIIGFAYNTLNSSGFQLVSKSDLKLTKIVEISSHEALMKFNSKSALFIDSRDKDDYQISHIKGALHVSVDNENLSYGDKKFSNPLLNVPREFVIYCGGVTCGLSKELAKKFIELGYESHIYVMKNGFPEWEKNKYPIESID